MLTKSEQGFTIPKVAKHVEDEGETPVPHTGEATPFVGAATPYPASRSQRVERQEGDADARPNWDSMPSLAEATPHWLGGEATPPTLSAAEPATRTETTRSLPSDLPSELQYLSGAALKQPPAEREEPSEEPTVVATRSSVPSVRSELEHDDDAEEGDAKEPKRGPAGDGASMRAAKRPRLEVSAGLAEPESRTTISEVRTEFSHVATEKVETAAAAAEPDDDDIADMLDGPTPLAIGLDALGGVTPLVVGSRSADEALQHGQDILGGATPRT